MLNSDDIKPLSMDIYETGETLTAYDGVAMAKEAVVLRLSPLFGEV